MPSIVKSIIKKINIQLLPESVKVVASDTDTKKKKEYDIPVTFDELDKIFSRISNKWLFNELNPTIIQKLNKVKERDKDFYDDFIHHLSDFGQMDKDHDDFHKYSTMLKNGIDFSQLESQRSIDIPKTRFTKFVINYTGGKSSSGVGEYFMYLFCNDIDANIEPGVSNKAEALAGDLLLQDGRRIEVKKFDKKGNDILFTVNKDMFSEETAKLAVVNDGEEKSKILQASLDKFKILFDKNIKGGVVLFLEVGGSYRIRHLKSSEFIRLGFRANKQEIRITYAK